MIFFLSCGDYITPLLVGGADSQTVGMDVATSFGQSADYGRGAAVSFLMLLALRRGVLPCSPRRCRAARLLPRGSMMRTLAASLACLACSARAVVFLFAPLVIAVLYAFNSGPN